MRKTVKNIVKNRLSFLPDELYIKLRYLITFGHPLNLRNPKTYNEKLQWLKLNDRNPLYNRLVDKYDVREFVTERIGEEYIIPCFGVWDSVDKIEFDKLPEQFVLKCTHDSGSVQICKDKQELDIPKIKKHFSKALRNNQYYGGREWVYKDVKPRILAEQYIVDDVNIVPCDYKVMCFNGEPKLIQLHEGRFSYHSQDFYDVNWNRMQITQGPPMSEVEAECPAFLERMLDLSRKLSADIPHVRVDWYFTNGQLYFGEMTFYDASGFEPFHPKKWDEIIGEWLEIKN